MHREIRVDRAFERAAKNAVRALLASKWVSSLCGPFAGGGVSIFALHRFGPHEEPTGMRPFSLDLLDTVVTRLKKDGYPMLSLEQIIAGLDEPETLEPRSVAFTIDDGYADFKGAAEVFLDHGCPATVFLVTGFIDGEHWLWWDEIEYICRFAPAGSYRPLEGEEHLVLDDSGDLAGRITASDRLASRLKVLPEDDKRTAIDELARVAGVEVPKRKPPLYEAMTWEEIRGLEKRGIGFAPHTVTHPILTRIDAERAEWEVQESWRRLGEELEHPVPVLCYPNGMSDDFSDRDRKIAEGAGLKAAVTMNSGYVVSRHRSPASTAPSFSLPRFSEPRGPHHACVTASGLYRDRGRRRARREPSAEGAPGQ